MAVMPQQLDNWPAGKKPLADKDYDRFAWLYDRVAKRLGVPPASSYPRI
jgi:hypothetical protein